MWTVKLRLKVGEYTLPEADITAVLGMALIILAAYFDFGAWR